MIFVVQFNLIEVHCEMLFLLFLFEDALGGHRYSLISTKYLKGICVCRDLNGFVFFNHFLQNIPKFKVEMVDSNK